MLEEQRAEIIRRLQKGEDLSPERARIIFPPEKQEYELVYHGKERETLCRPFCYGIARS
jgi:site-specific DNA-methyltransferase (adenine-specific)/adenine-specific DNA-methyltransferase